MAIFAIFNTSLNNFYFLQQSWVSQMNHNKHDSVSQLLK